MKPITINSSFLRECAALKFCDYAGGRTRAEIAEHMEAQHPGDLPSPQVAIIFLHGAGYLYIHSHGTATEPARYRTSSEGREYICMIADLCAAAKAAATMQQQKAQVTA